MREEWEKYLLGKVELRDLQTRYKKQAKDPKRFGILDVVAPITPTRKAEASSVNKQEHDALLTAAQKLEIKLKRNVLWEMIHCLMIEIGSKGCGKPLRVGLRAARSLDMTAASSAATND
ncbi:DNA repair endonuclease UVH1 [Fagus crenata]